MSIDLESLFEEPDLIGFDDELEALACRDKGMSRFEFSLSALQDGDDGYIELINWALNSGLTVVQSSDKLACIEVFVTSFDEMWRVHAFKMLHRAFQGKPWSDGAERMESNLLGYSTEAIDKWMNYLRNVRSGWTGTNIYILASDAHRNALSLVRNRCFLPDALTPTMTVFWDTSNRVLRVNADSMCDASHLGRVLISHKMMSILNDGDTADGVISRSITAESLDALNDSLESKVQFFSEGRWE